MLNIAFVLDHKLQHYRIPFFNRLKEKYNHNIVVFHKGEVKQGLLFEERIVKEKKIGPFRKRIFKDDLNYFDVVVYMQNIRYLDFLTSCFNFQKNYKIIQWGIGVSSQKGLGNQKILVSIVRNVISSRADSLVFYSEFPLQFLIKKNIEKSYVAHNTIFNTVSKDFSNCKKDSFLFVGTLSNRKGIDDLLESFCYYLKSEGSSVRVLRIIGGGSKENLVLFKELCVKLGISENVEFLGIINEAKEKVEYFKKAIACISPKQAGLSVLESFSFGVPFICYKNAISGGEHLNIRNDFNGFLVGDKKELQNKMLELTKNLSFAEKLGNNAYEYYQECRTMEHMVDNFELAIKNAIIK